MATFMKIVMKNNEKRMMKRCFELESREMRRDGGDTYGSAILREYICSDELNEKQGCYWSGSQ